MDAITLSLASSNAATGRTTVALVVALLANTAFKCVTVVVVGRGTLRRQVAGAGAAIGMVGVAATVLALR